MLIWICHYIQASAKLRHIVCVLLYVPLIVLCTQYDYSIISINVVFWSFTLQKRTIWLKILLSEFLLIITLSISCIISGWDLCLLRSKTALADCSRFDLQFIDRIYASYAHIHMRRHLDQKLHHLACYRWDHCIYSDCISLKSLIC